MLRGRRIRQVIADDLVKRGKFMCSMEPNITFIHGANGSGKTSILKGIYACGEPGTWHNYSLTGDITLEMSDGTDVVSSSPDPGLKVFYRDFSAPLSPKLRYAEGFHKKFGSYSDETTRVALFLKHTNNSLLYKELVCNYGEVFLIRQGKIADWGTLSRAEFAFCQLMFDIWMSNGDETIFLLDMLESGMHVVWQRDILGIMEEASVLCGHQFIVGTHSPQIIGGSFSAMRDITM